MQTPRRAALITGATSGIGEAFARALPTETALLLTGLEAVCAAAERFSIDLLICNAGLGPYGDFLDAPEASLRATVSVNVMAPLVLLRRLLPGMIARAEASVTRAGTIVLSSGAAFLPVPRLAAYAASKAFDLSLTEALSAELSGRPIDILALCPTATRSRFAERSGFGGTPPGAQQPEHVAKTALAALGKQRTLTLGPLSGSVLSAPALVRAAAAQAFQVLLPRR